ncbi:hypothetical protein C0995_002673 [Termitomyces sp. Mi166|nr:hypothetical protein C0995_002673 [Termitomyces sp. Mi166\
MRITSSHHSVSLRATDSDVWPPRGPWMGAFRPHLNIEALFKLLQIATSNDTSVENVMHNKGKKRASSPPGRVTRASKRVKTSLGSSASSSSGSVKSDSEDFDWHRHDYPELQRWRHMSRGPVYDGPVFVGSSTSTEPVMQHVFNIQYTRNGDGLEGWNVEEDNLLNILGALQRSEPRTIDLGDIDLIYFSDRLIVSSRKLESRLFWSLLLPLYDDEIDLAWHGLSSQRVRDIFLAAVILRSADRTDIQSRLGIVILPSGAVEEGELPFKLEIEVNVSFKLPTIFEALPWNRGKLVEVEDAQRRLLTYLYPSDALPPESYDGATSIPFFYSILRPAPQLTTPYIQQAMQPAELQPTLLPFQRRSVGWLLGREGKMITPNGEVVLKPQSTGFSFWEKVVQGNSTWYLNRLSGALSDSLPEVYPALGGILAEEPGLGKTLESISLILLNPAPPERNPSVTRWDPEARIEVKAIQTTLIVTPPALASQWADELAAHAPSLKVLKYDGWSKIPVPITQSQVEAAKLELLKKKRKGTKKSKGKRKALLGLDSDDDMDVDTPESSSAASDEIEIRDWCTYVNGFDVVITTYTVLRTDFNVALAAPVRPRREDVEYSNIERTRSPLVMVEWYRVIMDEVQMVGGGKIEDMVSLIPRLSSFAVSGTPARQQVADLMHVLKFLRVDDVIGSARLWSRLTSTGFGATHFAALFQEYGIRTLKANVKEELTIPQQTRYLVSIHLGPVEKHVYDQALEAALLELGLDARGVAGSEGWDIDSTVLRSAIRRLRGICTHPQVGQLHRPGDKLYKPGTVKTIDDVLQNMRETNWRTMMDNRKAKVQASIRVAQLQTHDENDPERFQRALNTLLEAEKDAQSLVDEAQGALDKHVANKQRKNDEDGENDAGEFSEKAKGRRRQFSEEQSDEISDSDDDSEDEEDLLGKGTGERAKKRSALQNRLRECRIALHRAKFLQGDMYHALGADRSSDEDAAYSAAESIRRGLLQGTEDDANRAVVLLTRDADKKNITQDALMTETPLLDNSELFRISKSNLPTAQELKAKPVPNKVTLHKRVTASIALMNEGNAIIENVLNQQSVLLWEWRTHITALLTQKIASSEDSPDGEEYQRTLDNQGEAETYIKSYNALLSDRRQALINERTLLAAHDVREKKFRQTKAATNALTAALLDLASNTNEDRTEIQPEHEVLHMQLLQKRKDLLKLLEKRSIKSVLVDLNAAATRITKDTDPEKAALKDLVVQLRQFLKDESTLTALQIDIVDVNIVRSAALMDKLDADLLLIQKAFNQRILYFRQLQEISDTVAEVEWEGTVLDALVQATTERDELDTDINKSRARHRYLDNLAKKKDDGLLDEDDQYTKLFSEINSMESFGDYGSKIQTLVRHLLYLKITDPDAKSIVFSAWADSLFIMERALTSNGIRCLRIDQKRKGESAAKRFKSDPEILVLLLHGERENAGLNITCASRVFLLESVVHHGFEVQAIARIDRMGQTRPTEVFCYYAEDTVERNILDLAARQGLSLYTKENSAGTLNVAALSTDADSKIADSPKKLKKKIQKGDFISKMDDMLAILFPHMYEELEFLISEDTEMESSSASQTNPAVLKPAHGAGQNTVAGPSRLKY